MPQKGTLSGSYTATVTLTTAGYTNPVTVTGAVGVIGANAISGPGPTVWTLANQGLVQATGSIGDGVAFAAGGSIDNAGAATIAGAQDGIYIAGGAAAVSNAGSIAGADGAGIAMQAGGSVYNAPTGTIAGTTAGLDISGGGTVTNAGRIAVAGGNTSGGVLLRNGGQVSNVGTGNISATGFGIYIVGASGTVGNTGVIAGNGESGVALSVTAGGTLTNSAGGYISGHYSGAFINGSAGTVVNYGSIGSTIGDGVELALGGLVSIGSVGTVSGLDNAVALGGSGTVVNAGQVAATNNNGILLSAGGSVTNQTGGVVSGYSGIYIGGGAGSVLNQGSVASTGNFGVRLDLGGTVSNAAGGTISTGEYGVDIVGAAGTVVNAGSIGAGGGRDAVLFAASYANRMVVYSGAACGGAVNGGNSIGNSIVSTLELATGNGTLAGIGTNFENFGSIVFDPGATWNIGGSTAGLASGAVISGFTHHDTIDLVGVTENVENFANGTLTLTGSAGLQLLLPGSFSDQFLATTSDDGTAITLACFVAGTRVLTDAGEVEVEKLQTGARVFSLLHRKLLPVVWIGFRTLSRAWPVRVRAGAFAPGVPRRDLWLSPDHAVYVDGALIPVRHLINGATIVRQPRDEVTYYHIELAEHGVLLAEGLPAESYLDTGNRAGFETEIVATTPRSGTHLGAPHLYV